MLQSLHALTFGIPRHARRLRLWTGLLKQRKALSELDDHLLRDIGITPEAARREARRPPWDAPDHWLG